jgi:hypothetical protein
VSKGLSARSILAASFLLMCLFISCPPASTAELKLSRVVWDFESVEQGDSKTQKIVLTNPGDQPLTIDRIELPKGCSVKPDLAKKEIQPKGELEVEFTFDSQGMLGKLQHYVYVILSDSTIIPLTIKGEVFPKAQPRLEVTPDTWDFGTVKVGESTERPFRCKNVGTADLKIEKVQVYDSKFRVVRNITKETLAPGEEVDFAISVNPTYPGKCETDFYLKSNSAGRTYTKISVKGYAVSKTLGVVVSSDLSSITNNTPYKVEVVRKDNLGKEEILAVERDSAKSFPREPGPQRVNPEEYSLTIRLAKPSPVIPQLGPPGVKVPSEEPSPGVEKPETAPPEGKPGEEAAPPGEQEKKPDQPKEEQATPSEKAEPETAPQETPAKPEQEKPAEGGTPPREETAPAKPEKPEAEKEPAPVPEKEGLEKPPTEPEKEKPLENPAAPPSAQPGTPQCIGAPVSGARPQNT